jgi:hypothetical protein
MQRTERQGFVKGCFGEKLVTVRREPAQASVRTCASTCSKTGALTSCVLSQRGPKPAPATRPCRTRQCRRLLHRGASSTLLVFCEVRRRGAEKASARFVFGWSCVGALVASSCSAAPNTNEEGDPRQESTGREAGRKACQIILIYICDLLRMKELRLPE